MEFVDAGFGVVGEVDVCAGEGVRDAGGRDVLECELVVALRLVRGRVEAYYEVKFGI